MSQDAHKEVVNRELLKSSILQLCDTNKKLEDDITQLERLVEMNEKALSTNLRKYVQDVVDLKPGECIQLNTDKLKYFKLVGFPPTTLWEILRVDGVLKGANIVIFDNTPKKKNYIKSNTPYKPPKRIEDLPIKIVHKGKTDENGIFHYRKTTNKHLSVLAVGNDRSYAFCSTGHPYLFKKELNKYFIYTDRPVYRAGDTVYYKIIGKIRGKKFSPIKKRRLYYEIVNRDFDEIVDEGISP